MTERAMAAFALSTPAPPRTLRRVGGIGVISCEAPHAHPDCHRAAIVSEKKPVGLPLAHGASPAAVTRTIPLSNHHLPSYWAGLSLGIM
jgi:hypothetical protein